MSLIEIKNLHARVAAPGGRDILKGVNLTINAGEVHAIMGKNGSGKSTLAQVLAGRDAYEVTQGQVVYDGKDLLELSAEERARDGIFLAFQYPVEIPGVSTTYFLKAAVNAVRKHRGEPEMEAAEFLQLIRDKQKLLGIQADFMKRSVNEGFSGGEKKRNEILPDGGHEPAPRAPRRRRRPALPARPRGSPPRGRQAPAAAAGRRRHRRQFHFVESRAAGCVVPRRRTNAIYWH